MTLANGASSRALSAAPSCGGDQPHLLALAAGMDGLGEGRDLALGRLEIAEPQLGIAREADPHRLVRRPFGKRGRRCSSAARLTDGTKTAKPRLVFVLAPCTMCLPGREFHMSFEGLLAASAIGLAIHRRACCGAPISAADAKAFGAREAVDGSDLSPDGTKIVYLTPGPGRKTVGVVGDLDTGKFTTMVSSDGKPESLHWCQFRGADAAASAASAARRISADGDILGFSRLIAHGPDRRQWRSCSASPRASLRRRLPPI